MPLPSRSTSRRSPPRRSAGEEAYSDVTTFPAVLQDLAVVVGEDIPAATVRSVVLGAGGDLLADARVFDLFHGEQVGEGHKSIALRLEFRAPDRTLTDEEVAGAARPHREGARADRRDPPWLSRPTQQRLDGEPAARVIVAGASGFAGALAAQLVWRHPRLELVEVTSRSDAGRPLSTSTRATGSRSS